MKTKDAAFVSYKVRIFFFCSFFPKRWIDQIRKYCYYKNNECDSDLKLILLLQRNQFYFCDFR